MPPDILCSLPDRKLLVIARDQLYWVSSSMMFLDSWSLKSETSDELFPRAQKPQSVTFLLACQRFATTPPLGSNNLPILFRGWESSESYLFCRPNFPSWRPPIGQTRKKGVEQLPNLTSQNMAQAIFLSQPRKLFQEPSGRADMRCDMCPTRTSDRSGRGTKPDERLK